MAATFVDLAARVDENGKGTTLVVPSANVPND
jgi:hypothetical protein